MKSIHHSNTQFCNNCGKTGHLYKIAKNQLLALVICLKYN